MPNFPAITLLGAGWLLSELALAWRRHSSREAKAERADGRSLRLLWLVIGTGIAAGQYLALHGIGPRLPGSHFPWWQFGVAVFALGTALRWWSIVHLGRFFTVDVALAADHQLVDSGPYRHLRHPSYTGLLGQAFGFSLAHGYLVSVAAICGPMFLALLFRMRIEERVLEEKLGPAYTAYRHRTWRLLPGLL